MEALRDSGKAGHKIDFETFAVNLNQLRDEGVEQMARATLHKEDFGQRRDVTEKEAAQETIVAKLKYLDNVLDLSA